MKKQILRGSLLVSLLCVLSFAFAKQEKVIQIFQNGQIVQSINASDIDYIEVNDLIATPENVQATVGDNQITITWKAVEGATYNVYRSIDNVNFTLLASNVKTNSYTDTAPLQGSGYYRIKAIINNTESSFTESICVSTAKESGVYVGINAFNKEIYKYPIVRLDEQTIGSVNDWIDGLPKYNVTLLYYSVDDALNALKTSELPADISTVAMVTFTDGVDDGSVAEVWEKQGKDYLDEAEYLNDLNKRILNEKVSGLPISAYSIGLRGNDVTGTASVQAFNNNLLKLASCEANKSEIRDVEALKAQFTKIAEDLTNSNYVQKIQVSIAKKGDNTIRFTFDNVSYGGDSKVYIEGKYNKKEYTLEDVKYVGMSSTSGSVIYGVRDDEANLISFSFEGIHTDNEALIKKEYAMQWIYNPQIDYWQKSSESEKDNNFDIETQRSSAAIMLVLDCSISLGNDFPKVLENAKGFINTLYKAYNEGGEISGGGSVVGNAEVETITVNGVSFDMIRVDGGSYMMGSNEGDSDEKPVHQETVETFYIGKTEVTQALWKAVMGTNPSYFTGDNLPVEMVSWNDCQTFISKLNELTGKSFRLPSEPEWEYAARGGNKSKGYTYSGSNTIGDVAWYSGNSGSKTHEVGTKAPNELGIYDMSGNVWEWTADYYSSDYSSDRSSSSGVYRGGSWSGTSSRCRSANRNSSMPSNYFNCLGLRLAF